jgi:hypothetical protein
MYISRRTFNLVSVRVLCGLRTSIANVGDETWEKNELKGGR